MRRATEAERRRLNDTFAELCRIPSPFGEERECADRVTGELRALGIEVEEDGAAAAAGAGAGNLLARLAGPGESPVLLAAHLDTVPQSGPIEPTVIDDGWQNAREDILGADNKAAVAVLLELAHRYGPAAPDGPPLGIELLFTVCEENALAGAKAFDASRLGSRFGYVFDHASPIGEIITASPTYFRFEADFRGAAAHAGIRPEQGRSAILGAARAVAAMPLGRLDEETTANLGTISGGSGVNVVPDRCRIRGEARSLDEQRVEELVAELVGHVHDGANSAECDVDVTVERLFRGYRTQASAPPVVAAERALQACGYEPARIATGGASDANALQEAGFPCVNLANGTERNHEPGERVSVAALEGMLDVADALLHAVAEC